MCKWTSSNDELMKNIKLEDRWEDKFIKTLGMIWNRKEDVLLLQMIKNDKFEQRITKRSIL